MDVQILMLNMGCSVSTKSSSVWSENEGILFNSLEIWWTWWWAVGRSSQAGGVCFTHILYSLSGSWSCDGGNERLEHACCKDVLFTFRWHMKRSPGTMRPFRNVLSLLDSADFFPLTGASWSCDNSWQILGRALLQWHSTSISVAFVLEILLL